MVCSRTAQIYNNTVMSCKAQTDDVELNRGVCCVCFAHVDIVMSINVGFMAPAESVHVPGLHHNKAVSGLKPEKPKQGVLGARTSARVQQVV